MTDYVVVWYCGKLTKGETFNRTGKIISQSMALMQTHTQTHTHTHARAHARAQPHAHKVTTFFKYTETKFTTNRFKKTSDTFLYQQRVLEAE